MWFNNLRYHPDLVLFKEQIFLGNSIPNTTEYKILQLHRMLDEALEVLGGEQQNGLFGTEYNHKEAIWTQAYLDNIAENIVMALTGKKIFLGDIESEDK